MRLPDLLRGTASACRTDRPSRVIFSSAPSPYATDGSGSQYSGPANGRKNLPSGRQDSCRRSRSLNLLRVRLRSRHPRRLDLPHVRTASQDFGVYGVGERIGEQLRTASQLVGEFACCRPLCGVLRKATLQDGQQLGWYTSQICLAVTHPVEQICGLPTPEGAVPGHSEHQHPSEREHVARGRVFLPGRLLGRHEGRRPRCQAGTRKTVVADGPRDTEVDDLRPLSGYQNVRRFEIPVHHA